MTHYPDDDDPYRPQLQWLEELVDLLLATTSQAVHTAYVAARYSLRSVLGFRDP